MFTANRTRWAEHRYYHRFSTRTYFYTGVMFSTWQFSTILQQKLCLVQDFSQQGSIPYSQRTRELSLPLSLLLLMFSVVKSVVLNSVSPSPKLFKGGKTSLSFCQYFKIRYWIWERFPGPIHTGILWVDAFTKGISSWTKQDKNAAFSLTCLIYLNWIVFLILKFIWVLHSLLLKV